jgi:DNA-binding FadR family transcriptional regulator
LDDPQQSAKMMEDLDMLRIAIEPLAAGMAATNHTDEDYQDMRRALRGMATYLDHTDKAEQDLAFHMAILRATRNGLFQSLGDLISVGLRHIFRAGFDATAEEDDRWIKRHTRVADAIRARDADAAEIEMKQLLLEAREVRK